MEHLWDNKGYPAHKTEYRNGHLMLGEDIIRIYCIRKGCKGYKDYETKGIQGIKDELFYESKECYGFDEV